MTLLLSFIQGAAEVLCGLWVCWVPCLMSEQVSVRNLKDDGKHRESQSGLRCPIEHIAEQTCVWYRLETVEIYWNEEKHTQQSASDLTVALLLPNESMTALKCFHFDMASERLEQQQAYKIKLGKRLRRSFTFASMAYGIFWSNDVAVFSDHFEAFHTTLVSSDAVSTDFLAIVCHMQPCSTTVWKLSSVGAAAMHWCI